jgi:hypothetical protein
MNRTPNGMPRATGRSVSRKNATRSVALSSTARTVSVRRRASIVACPAARRLRTQCTSPHGDQTQRRPSCSMMASGVVRGRPLVRPFTVRRPLKPIGTPAPRSGFEMALNTVIPRGGRS